jgi:hypothetical protein
MKRTNGDLMTRRKRWTQQQRRLETLQRFLEFTSVNGRVGVAAQDRRGEAATCTARNPERNRSFASGDP